MWSIVRIMYWFMWVECQLGMKEYLGQEGTFWSCLWASCFMMAFSLVCWVFWTLITEGFSFIELEYFVSFIKTECFRSTLVLSKLEAELSCFLFFFFIWKTTLFGFVNKSRMSVFSLPLGD
jgi:hypothetical protein